MTTKTTTAVCGVCGGDKPHQPASAACGVYQWFPRGEVRPIDLRINLGLVIDLLRDGSCVAEDGQIKRRDHYDADKAGWREFRVARDAMLAELTVAARRVMDAAAEEIIARLGAASDDGLDYRTLSPASAAMGRRPFLRETFADSTNWTGGFGRMFAALHLLQNKVAADLVATAALADRMIAEINERKQRQRQWAVEAAQQIVYQVADALWRLQYDRVQDIIDRMYADFAAEIQQIIGVDE